MLDGGGLGAPGGEAGFRGGGDGGGGEDEAAARDGLMTIGEGEGEGEGAEAYVT